MCRIEAGPFVGEVAGRPVGLSVSTTLISRRHLEASSHLLRGRDEHQHPRRARRAPWQADRRVHRAVHPHRAVRASDARPGVKAWQFISGNSQNPMVDLGWKSVGVLELTALPSIDEERGAAGPTADALLVAGGDVLYLCHWMRESGLADLLPSLSETVWVGLSAGSMVMTPSVGDDFIQWRPPTGEETTLGVVDFSICPSPGCRRHARQLHGRGGAVGGRHPEHGVRDGRSDGDNGGRRRRPLRFRRALGTAPNPEF